MSAIPSVSAATPPTSTSSFNDLSSNDFLRIMFTELTNQDPLKPNDSQALLDQVSSIRSIESNISLSDDLKSLVSQNELSAAGTLIGKFVSGLDEQGTRVADLVLSVSATKNGAVLNLASGAQLNMKRVEEIVDPNLINSISSGSGATTTNTQTTPGAGSTTPAAGA